MEHKEHFIGDSGVEDDIILAVLGETDGATKAEIKKFFEERGRKIDDEKLDLLLNSMVQKKKLVLEQDESYSLS